MEFEEFQNMVIGEMRQRFPEEEFDIREVSKLQRQSYTGLDVHPAGSNLSASVNLQPFFDQVEKGVPMTRVLHNLEYAVNDGLQNIPQVDVKGLMDYGQMKDQLTLQLIPIAGNEESLKAVPHQIIEDMAVVYRFELDLNSQGSSTILVNNDMLRTYGVSAEQLANDATAAAVENHPAQLRNMNEVLRSMLGEEMAGMVPEEETPLWVASVEGSMNGASVIQYPGFMEEAVKTLGGDYFVLPSSIHEVLLVADDGNMELSNLEDMVREVNATAVEPEDRLTDNVYHYDSEAHIFENAHTYMERMAAKEEEMTADQPDGMSFGENREESGNSTENRETMTVLLVTPGEYPQTKEIGKELADLQSEVGGDIEVVYPFEEPVAIILNEEGKMNGLPLNRALRDDEGTIVDVLAGNFMVAGIGDGDFSSLTPEQIDKYGEMFHQPEAFLKMGRSIMAIPIPEESLRKQKESRGKDAGVKSEKPKHKDPGYDGR